MDDINVILQEEDMSKLEFYLDYVELIIEMFRKRSLDTTELEKERDMILERISLLD
ncbi:MAG: hypothetical protein K9L74_05875 [Candidatus Izimaplasma sp.]|nr:hypothetical protein [Candidatus Izimaplasma bacterium]